MVYLSIGVCKDVLACFDLCLELVQSLFDIILAVVLFMVE